MSLMFNFGEISVFVMANTKSLMIQWNLYVKNVLVKHKKWSLYILYRWLRKQVWLYTKVQEVCDISTSIEWI